MFDVITVGIQVIMLLCQGYLLQYFLGSFLESRFFWKSKSGVFVVASFGILSYGMDLLLPSDYGTIRVFGKKLMTLIILFLITFCFYKAVQVITVYLIVTFMAVSDICFFIAYMIMGLGPYLTDFWVNLLGRGYFSSLGMFQNTVEITLIVISLVMYGIFIALTYFFFKKIVENFREKEYAITPKELLFLVTPGLVGLLLCVLLRLIMFTVGEGIPKLLYEQYPPLVWMVPAIMLLALLSILYGVKLFQDMIVLNREKSNRIILEQQIDSMQEQVKEIDRVYADMRSIKHDMKNSLGIVRGLIAEGVIENREFQDYLTDMQQTLEKFEFQFQTGNHVADTLLNMKYHEMIWGMPNLQLDADNLMFGPDLKIHSYDLGIILGNALDNAIEACRRAKEHNPQTELFIRLSSFRKGKMIFLEVANSFDGKIIRKPNSEFPVTNKADRSFHGMGLNNIKSTAEKYWGAMDWKVENTVFTLTVMLKNERRNEDGFGNNKFDE